MVGLSEFNFVFVIFNITTIFISHTRGHEWHMVDISNAYTTKYVPMDSHTLHTFFVHIVRLQSESPYVPFFFFYMINNFYLIILSNYICNVFRHTCEHEWHMVGISNAYTTKYVPMDAHTAHTVCPYISSI